MPLPKIKIKKEVNDTGSGKQTSRTLSIENKKGDKGLYLGSMKYKGNDGSSEKNVKAGFVGKKTQGSYEVKKSKGEGSETKIRNYKVTSDNKKEDVVGGYKNKIKKDTAFGNGTTSQKTKVSFDKNQNLSKRKQKTTTRINEPSKSSNTYKEKTKMNRFGSKVTTTRKGAVPVKQMKKK